MTYIEVSLTGTTVVPKLYGVLTSGMVGVPVRFSFDSAWEGLNKVAVFKGCMEKTRALIDDATTVPWEVLISAGVNLEVGVEGRKSDGTIVYPSVMARVGFIQNGADASADAGKDPTPSVYDDIMQEVNRIHEDGVKLAESEIDRIVGEYLVENPPAPGEKGDEGDPGKDGVGIVWIGPVATDLGDGAISTYEIVLTDGSTHQFWVKNGSTGSKGDKGDKGNKGDKGDKGDVGVGIVWVSNVVVSKEDGAVSTYEILLTDGSTYRFSVKNGSKGDPGYTPVKGIDYYTEADKQEMVDAVLAAQPNPKYELVETITIEENSEVSAWVRDDIACDKIMIKVVCPAEHANGKTTIGIGYNSYTLGMIHQAIVSNATNENHNLAEVFAEDGYWVCRQYLRTNKANSSGLAVQPRYYKVYTTKQCPYLNRYSITNIDNSLPAGTVISVYGVRRNEN